MRSAYHYANSRRNVPIIRDAIRGLRTFGEIQENLGIVLRNGIEIDDPVQIVLAFFEAYGDDEAGGEGGPREFTERDLRRANRGGARISADEIAAILERRGSIERALGLIAPDASLAGATTSVPWPALRRLFDAFGDIRGVGFAKMTKALYPKRPALIPMLDSVVQKYLADDALRFRAPFGERAVALVRGYKRDLDRNRSTLRTVRRELAKRGHGVTEVRIVDILICCVHAQAEISSSNASTRAKPPFAPSSTP